MFTVFYGAESRDGLRGLKLILALSLASLALYINLYVFQGMLPAIAEQFAVLPSHASLLLSIGTLSMAVSLLFVAILSDKFGRRTPIMLSLVALLVVDLMFLFVTSFEQLLWVRLLQGVTLAVLPATAMALFKEQLDTKQLLVAGAVYIAMNSLGGIGGRILGGLFSQYLSWSASVWGLMLVTLVLAAPALWLLRETTAGFIPPPHHAQKRDMLTGFWLHLSHPSLRLTYVVGALAFLVMVNQFSFIQLHLMASPYNLNRLEVTLIFLCYLSGTWVSFHSVKAINHFGHKRLLPMGALMMLLGTSLTWFAPITMIILGFLLSSLGFFLIHSACNSYVAVTAREHKAKATSLYLCCYYLGAAIGGPLLMPSWLALGWHGVVYTSSLILLVLFGVSRHLARIK
ncbi:MFS transporter [Shewanella sp. NIFS-20-20]|uniref:MFS transporter n=1 Tax=Shewanella sp. NIFS-20-20 TaxID=2853806 RepID=UPI001C46573D|nr:MFS transporter [Shewanella sp. NIFS-20-20]MBV7314864.1 MFS transporter [Shewanella sp. NIFS-20-20]